MRNRFVLVLAFFAALCFSPLAYAGGHGHGGGDDHGHDDGHGGDDDGHHDGDCHGQCGTNIRVFYCEDINANDVCNTGDAPASGWDVELFTGVFAPNTPVAQHATDQAIGVASLGNALGWATFWGLQPGTYTVCAKTDNEIFVKYPNALTPDPGHGISVSERTTSDSDRSRFCWELAVPDACSIYTLTFARRGNIE